jgi:hypothetical protein
MKDSSRDTLDAHLPFGFVRNTNKNPGPQTIWFFSFVWNTQRSPDQAPTTTAHHMSFVVFSLSGSTFETQCFVVIDESLRDGGHTKRSNGKEDRQEEETE